MLPSTVCRKGASRLHTLKPNTQHRRARFVTTQEDKNRKRVMQNRANAANFMTIKYFLSQVLADVADLQATLSATQRKKIELETQAKQTGDQLKCVLFPS